MRQKPNIKLEKLFTRAVDNHLAGNLNEAEKIYKKIIVNLSFSQRDLLTTIKPLNVQILIGFLFIFLIIDFLNINKSYD